LPAAVEVQPVGADLSNKLDTLENSGGGAGGGGGDGGATSEVGRCRLRASNP